MKSKTKLRRKPTPSYAQIFDPQTRQPISCFTHGGAWQAPPLGMPSEAVIYGMHYKVYYHTHIYNEPKKAQRLRGIVMYGPRIILLDPRQTIHELRETLYHEIAHVYLKTWQTKSENIHGMTYAQVEDTCDMFGEAIYDLISNNVKLQ